MLPLFSLFFSLLFLSVLLSLSFFLFSFLFFSSMVNGLNERRQIVARILYTWPVGWSTRHLATMERKRPKSGWGASLVSLGINQIYAGYIVLTPWQVERQGSSVTIVRLFVFYAIVAHPYLSVFRNTCFSTQYRHHGRNTVQLRLFY